MKNEKFYISGIQQIGVGVTDLDNAWDWYSKNLGFDLPVFRDKAEAALMTQYTGNEVHTREAILALNLNGGGGLEIWQFLSRKPEVADTDLQIGDLGLNCLMIKQEEKLFTDKSILSPDGSKVENISDPYGNRIRKINYNHWFQKNKPFIGGVCGAMIGVSDLKESLDFYAKVFGFSNVIYSGEGKYDDLASMKGGDGNFKRAIVEYRPKGGAFSRLLGPFILDFVQATDRQPSKIYQGRYWGDPGFIHLCFDVENMNGLKEQAKESGVDFKVDSGETFNMASAGGRFAYVEDPDGTLIELVETHKLPIAKRLGWKLDLKKRPAGKPLPDWLLKMMRFSKAK